MSDIELLSPAGVATPKRVPLAPRVPSLEGRVIGLLDNSKTGTTPFLDGVEELLKAGGVGRVVRYAKNSSALPAPEHLLESMATECDAVVNGIAD
jgi:hypothetical protein